MEDTVTAVAPTSPGRLRDFVTGMSLFVRGAAVAFRNPRLMMLGLIPAVLAAVVLVAALIGLLLAVPDLAGWLTWFADDWSAGLRQTVRILASVAIVGIGLVLSVICYTALTLLIGQPFYEAISARVDDSMGGLPGEVDVKFWPSLWRGAVDSVRALIPPALCAIPLFLGGFIPVIGETVVPVVAALVGGWALTVELTGVAFERRGLRYRDRVQLLRGRRALALGFGVATFLTFLVPLGAVVLMPAAVAGATVLTRMIGDEPVQL